MIRITALKENGRWAILDSKQIEEIQKAPEDFMNFTFVCPATLFPQKRPYFSNYSTRIATLLDIRGHFNWNFVFLTNDTYKIRDKAILRNIEGLGVISYGK